MAKLSVNVIGTEYKWYAVYTRLNHEKAVEASLLNKEIEVFLPKRKVLRKWADRKKLIVEPLFSQYVFVRICHKEYFEVLGTSSVLYFVMFEGKAVSIPDGQIEMIKEVVRNDIRFEVIEDNIIAHRRVILDQGPLKGYVGEIVNYKGTRTLQLAIDNLNYSILVNLNDIIPCPIS